MAGATSGSVSRGKDRLAVFPLCLTPVWTLLEHPMCLAQLSKLTFESSQLSCEALCWRWRPGPANGRCWALQTACTVGDPAGRAQTGCQEKGAGKENSSRLRRLCNRICFQSPLQRGLRIRHGRRWPPDHRGPLRGSSEDEPRASLFSGRRSSHSRSAP